MIRQEGRDFSPREIVAYLDRYVIGQEKAKRAVAVALRNRLRRRRLPEEAAREIAPGTFSWSVPLGWVRRRSPAASRTW